MNTLYVSIMGHMIGLDLSSECPCGQREGEEGSALEQRWHRCHLVSDSGTVASQKGRLCHLTNREKLPTPHEKRLLKEARSQNNQRFGSDTLFCEGMGVLRLLGLREGVTRWRARASSRRCCGTLRCCIRLCAACLAGLSLYALALSRQFALC